MSWGLRSGVPWKDQCSSKETGELACTFCSPPGRMGEQEGPMQPGSEGSTVLLTAEHLMATGFAARPRCLLSTPSTVALCAHAAACTAHTAAPLVCCALWLGPQPPPLSPTARGGPRPTQPHTTHVCAACPTYLSVQRRPLPGSTGRGHAGW